MLVVGIENALNQACMHQSDHVSDCRSQVLTTTQIVFPVNNFTAKCYLSSVAPLDFSTQSPGTGLCNYPAQYNR